MPTKIEWAEETWNPVTGCTAISPGCAHCYARQMAHRLKGRYGYPADDPFRVTVHEDKMDQPLGWKKPRAVFVCSMGDLFHADVPRQAQDEIFDVIARTPQHTYMLLTKRPENMARYILGRAIAEPEGSYVPPVSWPLPNVWLGVTGETEEHVVMRGGTLLVIPAAVHFMSLEPLLEAVDLMPLLECEHCGSREKTCIHCSNRSWLDWVIVGEETGPGARPAPPLGVQQLLRQAQVVGVPFMFKRWNDGTRLVEGKTWDQKPEPIQ